MAGAVKSRLVNLLGLSDKDIPLELREQFGYAKKHSIELEATRDTTKDYLSTVVPLGGAISRMAHEFWHNGCKTTLSFAYFKTLREGLTAKLELQSGVVKVQKLDSDPVLSQFHPIPNFECNFSNCKA